MSSKKKAVAKAETFSSEKAKETVKKVGAWTPQSVSQKVSDATVAINKTFSDVSSQLQGVLKEYDEANQAVQLKQDELETIFGKEQVLKSIDELNAEHENQKILKQQEFDLFQQELDAKQQTLELERTKENEQFQFNLQQSRRNEQLQHEETLRIAAAQERDRKEQIEKGFQARNEELTKKEAEFIDLRKQVADFPAKLDAEVKKAEAIVGSTVKRDWEHKLQLLQKDFDASTTVHNNTVATLNARLANNDKVISELTARLASSEEKVSAIATKALEAASSTKSLADVQNLLQNQNNGQPARKA